MPINIKANEMDVNTMDVIKLDFQRQFQIYWILNSIQRTQHHNQESPSKEVLHPWESILADNLHLTKLGYNKGYHPNYYYCYLTCKYEGKMTCIIT